MEKATKKELLSLVCIFFILVFVFAIGLHLSYDEDFLLCIVYSLLAFPSSDPSLPSVSSVYPSQIL